MTSLLVFVFRVGLLAALTFAFVVLYQHGTSGFVEGIPVEWKRITTLNAPPATTPDPESPGISIISKPEHLPRNPSAPEPEGN
jgi:hypothetical protein